ncbi:hypothetical protein [Sphingobium tyrosinilyticum]|uniref:Uncharacterized protein n=1 Tax=Sphingobium tyrosinilyticum TaxID=2715436 RepID=A0ABV9F395_9SPHN
MPSLEIHAEMGRRMYEPQMTPRWPILEQPSAYTVEGTAREPWTVSFYGPLNGESSMTTNGVRTKHTAEYEMYWKYIPDFRITEYKVWPTPEGWIARIIYEGTTKDGIPVLAHQVDIVTVDETAKVVRLEWHCDAGEWIREVWTRSSGLTEAQVREVLAQPKGFDRLCEIALGNEVLA